MNKPIYKPILIYTVGRVSSTSIYNLCEEATDYTPYHVHYLSPATHAKQVAIAQKTGAWGQDVKHAMAFSERRTEYHGKLKIINIVRDPIARTLSLFFSSGQAESDMSNETKGPQFWENLLRKFLQYDRHTELNTWVQTEFNLYTGINLLKSNYVAKYGWGRTTTREFDILTFQCELDEKRKLGLLNSFLGARFDTIPHDYSTSERAGHNTGSLYREFLENVTLPREYVDFMYGLETSRFFYSKEQIAAMRKRWLKQN